MIRKNNIWIFPNLIATCIVRIDSLAYRKTSNIFNTEEDIVQYVI